MKQFGTTDIYILNQTNHSVKTFTFFTQISYFICYAASLFLHLFTYYTFCKNRMLLCKLMSRIVCIYVAIPKFVMEDS